MRESKDIIQTILTLIPKEAEVTRIDFEGPRIAIYTKKPEVLTEESYLISEIVKTIKKRVVIRSDPSVRESEEETTKAIKRIVPSEANIVNLYFDPTVGEVIIEAEKPGLVLGKEWINLRQIIKETRWRPHILRAPSISSKMIANIRHFLYRKAKEREKILRSIGNYIFRESFSKEGEVLLTFLGGSQQVGRSALLLETQESKILLDCGINPGLKDPIDSFPRLDIDEFDLESLDAVIITHAHLDHCGFVPYLYKYGYDGPVYCSEPTLILMSQLQLDYLDVLSSQGRPIPYNQNDVRKMVLHTIPLPYESVTDISPDVRVTLYNAGHILGSSILHLHIGEGLHNIIYTGDYKFMPTLLFKPANAVFPRVETLITEATYGSPDDIMPSRTETEQTLTKIVNETLKNKGKVLIPSLAVGRAQEIMLTLDKGMREGTIEEVPIFIEGMISEITAIHTVYPEFLSRYLRDQVLKEGTDPFKSEYFTTVKSSNERPSIIEGEPCIILATSGMLEGGPVLEYFKYLAPNERNTIVFVSYQIEGTLGRKILNGVKEVPMFDESGKVHTIKLEARIEMLKGFSGHSDRRQIIAYMHKISSRPKLIIVNHGEKSKCLSIANAARNLLGVNSIAPANLETIRLR